MTQPSVTALKRAALAVLSHQRLAELTQAFEVFVVDRRSSKLHIDALARARSLDFAELLGGLKLAELKGMCRALELSGAGREKQALVERILERIRGRIPARAEARPAARSAAAPARARSRASRASERAAVAYGAPPEAQARAPRARGRASAASAPAAESRAGLGFESKLWDAADVLRNNMDPAEYKHVVLGLIFLKYISDAFEARRRELARLVADPRSEYFVDEGEREQELAELFEDRDEYTQAHVFWVPAEARWPALAAQARQRTIGKLVDDAMDAIERANPSLRGALPKIYAMPNLDRDNLGNLMDLISGIGLASEQGTDVLGRVYEYFLSRFASAEGKGGGEFYTPQSVVRLLVEMLEPYRGRVYDPCCGSGGMFVQSLKFIEAHNGRRDQVTIFGQESNATTWRMARMNLAIRGIEARLGERHADTFREDLHPDLRADFILANPPFNVSVWHRVEDDVRWAHGTPPAGNANFAWVQHFVHHLAPRGTAGFVLANGSMSSMQSGEGEIRRKLVEANLVDCMVALPGQLFYSTQIPVCLWFLARERSNGRFRDRRERVLFIDARQLGRMDGRVHRVLDDADIERVAGTYHAWRNPDGVYEDVPGFCKSASLEEIAAHDFVLTPGRYVGAAEVEEDGEPFDSRIRHLTRKYKELLHKSQELDGSISSILQELGYDEEY